MRAADWIGLAILAVQVGGMALLLWIGSDAVRHVNRADRDVQIIDAVFQPWLDNNEGDADGYVQYQRAWERFVRLTRCDPSAAERLVAAIERLLPKTTVRQ